MASAKDNPPSPCPATCLDGVEVEVSRGGSEQGKDSNFPYHLPLPPVTSGVMRKAAFLAHSLYHLLPGHWWSSTLLMVVAAGSQQGSVTTCRGWASVREAVILLPSPLGAGRLGDSVALLATVHIFHVVLQNTALQRRSVLKEENFCGGSTISTGGLQVWTLTFCNTHSATNVTCPRSNRLPNTWMMPI